MRSEYHPAIAFDDLADGPFYGVVTGARDPLDAAVAIAHRARAKRARSPSRVIGNVATPTFSFAPIAYFDILGDDAPVELPIYGALYKQFADGLPEPKLARVDDVASYADFRAARREPYLAQLEARLTALEIAFAAHVADNHGGGRLDALEAALHKHIDECVHGGEAIELPIAQCRTGQIECWQDGPEILCTVRILRSDGDARMVTSGTQVARTADTVVGAALDEGLEPEELLTVGPAMIQFVGAAKLTEEVCGAAISAIRCLGGGTGGALLAPVVDPSLAAAMMLLQRCQQGDWAACTEARRMQKGHPALLEEAGDRLLFAQRMLGGRLYS